LGEGRSPLAEAFRQRVPVEEIPVAGRFSREAVRRIREVMQREGAAVLHSTGYKADCHAAWAGRNGAFSVVGTVHGWLFRWRFKERVFQALNLRALRRFSRVIVLSGFYERYLRRHGFTPLQVARIPTGVRAEGIATEAEACRLWKAAGPVFTFGMLGRLSSEKNHRLLLRAAARLARERETCPQSWRILVAGEGTLRRRLERQARRLGIADRVEWGGWMDSRDFFRRVHVLVQCSKVENQPMGVLEAMAWTALARAMRDCLAAPERVCAAGCRGRERLTREFPPDRMIEDHIGLYEAECHSWRAGERS
jgi:glycosyltransferase involved in cell wall biosynthesis